MDHAPSIVKNMIKNQNYFSVYSYSLIYSEKFAKKGMKSYNSLNFEHKQLLGALTLFKSVFLKIDF